jgi:1-acyl-sn-glycerol-3-phosphate acyltransferase
MEKVDIRKVFRDKSPAIARWLPGFIFRYLERIVHQDYINWFLEKYGHLYGIDFVNAVITEFQVNVELRGEENLPETGRFIFAGNHPLGGFDGLMLIHYVSKKYSKAIFLVNDILMNIRNMEELFVPVNKHGSQSRENFMRIEEMCLSDVQILTFPSGFVSRRIGGKIQDLEWQKNFIVKAVQHRRDVIPVHTSGRNTSFFYNLANIRKFLGIRWNLEMLYLVDETYRHRNQTLTITFGKPLPYTTFDKSLTYKEWAHHVRGLVYSLPSGNSGTS